ncbi:hypothetical protein D9M68_822450 [compost metagenome]
MEHARDQVFTAKGKDCRLQISLITIDCIEGEINEISGFLRRMSCIESSSEIFSAFQGIQESMYFFSICTALLHCIQVQFKMAFLITILVYI